MTAKNQESATESHSLEVLHTVTHLQRKANVHLKLMCEYQRKPVVLGTSRESQSCHLETLAAVSG